MHSFSWSPGLCRGLLSLLTALWLTCTAVPILAEPTRHGGTLIFVTRNDLKVLDPFWTTAYILTSWIFGDLYSPAVNQAVDGACERDWFGWYCSEAMERLRAEWARSENPDKRKALVEQIQLLAYDEVPYVPLGQWTQRRA